MRFNGQSFLTACSFCTLILISMAEKVNDKILHLLREKVLLKNEVFEKTKNVFAELKTKLQELSDALNLQIGTTDPKINVGYKVISEYEVEFAIADETMIFLMHTNIFTFDHSHEIWKTKYVREDESRSFCGKIFIYNFLSDSFKYRRKEDEGYLVARIFVNREGHFFVEGRKHLDYLYSDFSSMEMTTENLQKILEAAVIYCLNFDPFTPPFDQISKVSVENVLDKSLQSRIQTGKRLGFEFGASSAAEISAGPAD